MTDKPDPRDESYSALPCGCDPRENYVCEQHADNRQCVMGHWIRRDNCPACRVLVNSKLGEIEIPEGY